MAWIHGCRRARLSLLLLAFALGWFRIPRAASAPPLTPVLELRGHESGIYHVTFSPDGKRIATSGKDKTVRLWDAATGRILHVLKGHRGDVYSSCFSPDGAYLASASEDTSLKLWEVASGKLIRSFDGHTGDVYCVAFSPDGKRLASGSGDRSVRLWDVATGKELHELASHSGRVLSVAFHPDNLRLASSCPSSASESRLPAGEVRIWNTNSGELIFSLPSSKAGIVTVAFSAEGNRLAGSSLGQGVVVWETATGKESRVFAAHTHEVYHLNFSPEGRRLASCSGLWSEDRPGELKIYDLASGKELLSFQAHAAPTWSVAFSPDGKRLASASGRWNGKGAGEVKVWDVAATMIAPPAKMLGENQLEQLWKDLGGADADTAYRAVWALRDSPDQTVPFLAAHVGPPVTNAAPEFIARLIVDLDDNEYEVREKAAAELEKIGQAAHPALRKALASNSKEVQRRVTELLEMRGEAPRLSPAEIQMTRAIEVLEMIGTPAVIPALRKMASGPAAAPITLDARRVLNKLERATQGKRN